MAPLPAPPQSISFCCPFCATALIVPESMRHVSGPCPKCYQEISLAPQPPQIAPTNRTGFTAKRIIPADVIQKDDSWKQVIADRKRSVRRQRTLHNFAAACLATPLRRSIMVVLGLGLTAFFVINLFYMKTKRARPWWLAPKSPTPSTAVEGQKLPLGKP
jgi:hypothetical protein